MNPIKQKYSVFKDDKRILSNDDKIGIYNHSPKICCICGRKLKFNECHFDHIVAHANGGKTSRENTQILCEHCNKTKSAK